MKPALRIFWATVGGKRSGTLLRRIEYLFDQPAPAAIADDDEQVLRALARQVAALRAEGQALQRYLWTEDFEVRKVDVAVHPQHAVGGAYVIGKSEIPLRLAYAACPLADGSFRVLVPRVGWSLVLETLDIAADTLHALTIAAMLGERPAWIYDFRRLADEAVTAWSPDDLERWLVADRSLDDDEPVPVLDAVAEDWVQRALRKRLPIVVGVDPTFDQARALLDRERPPSLLLVGPPGVGKSAFVRRCARHLVEAGRGKGAIRRRLWATSADRILAGMTYLGMWQERCLAIAGELTERGDWMHVDRLADVCAPQADGASIADLFAPAIIAGELRVIAECDETELVRCRQKYPALVDAFHLVRFEEPAPAHVLGLMSIYQERKDPRVALHPAAARRALRLLAGFRRDVRFPGKAFAFLDWWNAERAGDALTAIMTDAAAAEARAPDAAAPADAPEPPPVAMLFPHDVVAAFARWSGLPVELISDEHPAGAAEIAAGLRRGVIGQDAACAVAARVLARFKAGLDDPERPVGTLFFVGPTGVGKTELAKQLAASLYGSAERLIRVDMSEYMTPGSATRLLEVGSGGQSLAERVRQTPLCVVLLDEIEKAHPEVHDLLLGVLGEGRLTDSLGRLVDFRMAVIAMTSNLGARESRAGFGSSGTADHLGAVRAHFRPELLGRLDQVVSFNPLTPPDIERIVSLELDKVRQRPGLVGRRLVLHVSPRARARLAERGFDAKLGARPLRRLIEEIVVAPLAVRMAADPDLRDRPIGIVTADDASTSPDDIMV
ncbi:MAG: AAA family ATPase [Deltaproteobacteria bacterium]|nr:AAA family ATPase [Deltaproteobacteria bacterium]